MTKSIFQEINDAHLDKELEVILLKLIWHNSSPNVSEPIRQFLLTYNQIYNDYWEGYAESNTVEDALDCYYRFAKNKCTLVDNLLDTLNFTLNSQSIREDFTLMMKNSLTF